MLAAQKQIVKKSVARIGHTEKAGHREQTRPEGSPSRTPYCSKDGPTGAEERRRRCCASGILVKCCNFDTGFTILQFCGIELNRLFRNEASRQEGSTKGTQTAYSTTQYRNSCQFNLWFPYCSKPVSVVTRIKFCSVSELRTE